VPIGTSATQARISRQVDMALGMRVAHMFPMVGRRSLGIGPAAPNLAKQQRKLGCEAKVWCTDSKAVVHTAVVGNGMPDGGYDQL